MNRFNNPIKDQRLSEWIKNMIKLYAVYKKRVIFKDTHELKGKGSKNIYHAKSNHKKAGVTTLYQIK